ncbi:ABC transporter substrate-binding protein [Streptomyces sp. NPDC092296]|uniref:ABC transporter substrate-binding protein n=1 Tax=Streptomyces sp. NPDC092296 TaxID=3366012 RepID=UPI003815BD25
MHQPPTPPRPRPLPSGGLSRRGLLGAAAGTAALFGLAACGSGGSSGGSSGGAAASAKSSGAATRLVDSTKGKIRVPDQPKRVVALNDFPMGAMFDLGITPIGVFNAGEQYVAKPYLDRWRPIAKVSDGVGGAIQVEKVAALEPDLILAIDAQSDLPYAQLTKLAPTVVLPFSKSKAPWRDMADATAEVLGVPTALDALKKRYSERTAGIKQQYAEQLARYRWDLLQGGFDEGQWWLYGTGSPIGGILADAGARFATASGRGIVQESVSYELVGSRLADADAIFYYTTNDGQPANLGPKLFAQKSFQRLPAAREHRLFGSVAFLPAGYSEALMALDDFESALKQL